MKQYANGGGGGGEIDPSMLMSFMQSGGYIPGYSNGGYTGVPILDERKYADELMKQRAGHDKFYESERKKWEGTVEDRESGMSGFGGKVLDALTPKFLEAPLASWAMDTPNAENWSGVPRQKMENYMSQISPHISDIPSEVQMTPELMALKYSLEEVPTAPSSRGLSDEALKRKVRESQGNFNASDWLQQMYGDNWWSSSR